MRLLSFSFSRPTPPPYSVEANSYNEEKKNVSDYKTLGGPW